MLCNEGANLPCGKANIRRSLPGATAWCKEKPNSSFIPMVATGHDTIYTWHCVNGVATPGDPVRRLTPAASSPIIGARSREPAAHRPQAIRLSHCPRSMGRTAGGISYEYSGQHHHDDFQSRQSSGYASLHFDAGCPVGIGTRAHSPRDSGLLSRPAPRPHRPRRALRLISTQY